MQMLQVQVDDCIPRWQIFVEQEETVDNQLVHWQSPSTIWEGRPVLGFMAETHLRDLKTVGFKNFNPTWSFQLLQSIKLGIKVTFGMPAYHLTDDTEHDKDALVSQSPIVVFKAATVLQALGIIHSRYILPSSDVKGDKKNKTYCPSTWNHAYQYQSPVDYSDMLRDAGAGSILSRECVLSVIDQLSSKSSSHPGCSFADSASSAALLQPLCRRFQGPLSCQNMLSSRL